ncbi:MAG: molybdopterin-synthase adenylyltransferase MoeB [Gemmatimonadota bacterium]|nr:MAG: molybdopterin-synthase adenylyltransferase MoeB [Gemmatimonadota bacterium]
MSDFTHSELIRYSRHLALPQVGPTGQRRIKAARVLLVGAGGLGSPAAMYLAAAGVGTLGLVDFDVVDLSNLQRQIIHGTGDVGRPKLESAAERLRDVNPFVAVEEFATRLDSSNATEIISGFDIVVDGSDNFPTRYLVNDACVLTGKPYVYGSVYRFEGQASVFAATDGPCYRCLFREPPPPHLVPSCSEGGVVGVLPGIVGSIQALEAIKLILEEGETLVGRLALIDALKLRFRELKLRRDPECSVCGEHPSVRQLIDYEAFCGAEATVAQQAMEITVGELAQRLESRSDLLLVDVREQYEWEICRIVGAVLVPLGELQARMRELDGTKEIVTLCHLGIRSLVALEILRAAGFSRVRSLQGGIDAWARQVEPTMAVY